MNAAEKHFHSAPAFWFFLVFAGGIIWGWLAIQSIPFPAILISLIVFVSCAWLFRRISLLFLFPAVILLGILRLYFALAAFPEDHLLLQNTKRIKAVDGWISEAQYRREGKHRYVLQCVSVYTDSSKIKSSGKIYIFQGKYKTRLHYGQNIRISSPLQKPPLPGNPGAFNFRKYLQMKGVYFQTYLKKETCLILPGESGNYLQRTFLIPLRDFLRAKIETNIPDPAGAVVKALILGERQDVDRGILKQFQKTGIVHVLAVSGLHVGFILMLFLLLFGLAGLSYKKRTLASLLFLFVFIALIDFKAPVLRAGIMAALYFAGQFMERKTNALNIIGVAGLLILIFAPQQLLQPGFQFSFAAAGSILYAYPKFRSLPLFKTKQPFINKWVMQPFLVSLSAVLGTVPLTWWYYGSLQTGAILVNVLLIPLIGGFVVLSFIFTLVVGTGLGIGAGLGWILYYYFEGVLTLNALFSRLPFIRVNVPRPSILSILLLLALLLLLFNLKKKTVFPALLLLAALFYLNSGPPDRLRITFVNVGQGDGAIIQFPNGTVMVVDGGDRKYSMDCGTRYLIPLLHYYGIKRINYLVSTHPHSDHFGGLISILKTFPTDTTIVSRYPGKSKLYGMFLKEAQRKRVPLAYKQRGDRIFTGNDSRVYVLHPYGKYLRAKTFSGNEVNNSSLVLKICYGNCSFLLTGDLEQNGETNLLNYKSFLKADLLKVGHHGSKTSTSEIFLNLIKPHFSVVSVGRHNKFFHPSRKTMQRLRRFGARPLRTDHFGALVFECDGNTIEPINWR